MAQGNFPKKEAMENKEEGVVGVPRSLEAVGAAAPGLINQLRQLSIPLWTRCLALTLAVLTLLLGILLVGKGWLACDSIECSNQWLEQGGKVIASAFLPVIAIIYLVFAETGTRALLRKSDELLDETLKDGLSTGRPRKYLYDGPNQISVEHEFVAGQPSAIYRITLMRDDQRACLMILVELNVFKVNVLSFIPCAPGDVWRDAGNAERFRTTLTGAVHEGYAIDADIPVGIFDGQAYFKLTMRKRLAENFLWDPAKKLYFVQDLRMFCHSMLEEGWELFANTGQH